MPTKAKTTVGKTPACLDKSGEGGHLGGGKIRLNESWLHDAQIDTGKAAQIHVLDRPSVPHDGIQLETGVAWRLDLQLDLVDDQHVADPQVRFEHALGREVL